MNLPHNWMEGGIFQAGFCPTFFLLVVTPWRLRPLTTYITLVLAGLPPLPSKGIYTTQALEGQLGQENTVPQQEGEQSARCG